MELEANLHAVEPARIDYFSAAPAAVERMLAIEAYLRECGLEHGLLHLVKIRASQLNGCAYCLDMHAKDLRDAGESEQRLYLLDAWREAPVYTDRERAALAWTEAVTLIGEQHVPRPVYDAARRTFSERELVDLTMALVAINGWNRLCIAFRTPAGGYRPHRPSASTDR